MTDAESKPAPVDYCENCFYFKSDSVTETAEGICRRGPPIPVNAMATPTDSGEYFSSIWPRVFGTEWCGQHKRLITTSALDSPAA